MKKAAVVLFLLIVAVGLVTGISYYTLENQVSKLNRTVARLQMTGASETGVSFRPFRSLTGNTAGCLDYLDGASVSVGDVAFVSLNAVSGYGDSLLVYNYRDFGAEVTESIPYIIKPDTNPNTNYAWSLELSSIAYPKTTTGNLDLDTSVTTGGVAIVRAGYIFITGAGTIKLPSAASVGYGTTICVFVDDASETCTIDVNASDIINLHGTLLDAGDSIDSPGNAGDFICLIAVDDVNGDTAGTDDGWHVLGYGSEAWTDGGAT